MFPLRWINVFGYIILYSYWHIPAYKVRFALTSSPVFSRTDIATDSERFYNSIVEFLEDPDENTEVQELLVWWNRWAHPNNIIFPELTRFHDAVTSQVFPGQTSAKRPISKDSVLAKLKEKRAALKLRLSNQALHDE